MSDSTVYLKGQVMKGHVEGHVESCTLRANVLTQADVLRIFFSKTNYRVR